jgi:hypothetical protein
MDLRGAVNLATGLAALLYWGTAGASGYVGVGGWDSQFYGFDHDRIYEPDTNRIRSLRFSWDSQDLAGLFGDVQFDGQNRVHNLALGLVLDDYLIHLEQGKISGDIKTESGGQVGEFDNDYLGVNVISRETNDGGFGFGYGYQKFAMPIRFEIGRRGEYNDHIQDDAVDFQHLGFGVYRNPIRNYLLGERKKRGNTWYFATNLVVGLSKAVTSDAPEMVQNNVDREEFYLFGNSGSYELGWFIGTGGKQWGVAANIGYHIRAVTLIDWGQFPDFPEPGEGEILPPSSQLILHGPRAEIRLVF